MKKLAFLFFFLMIQPSFAFQNEASKTLFCKGRQDKKLLQQRFMDPKEKLSIINAGGIGGMGVCWWHSRFQRNAFYLANYEPKRPKPTHEEARKIIKAIRSGNEVVSIPGFSNLGQFSQFFGAEIQQELENWQLIDGFLKQKWIQGLSGSSRSASDLKKNMDQMFQDVEEKSQIGYLKVQSKGVEAHALLVGSMKKIPQGYILKVADSNDPKQVRTLEYFEGDDQLYPYANVYVEFTSEVTKLQNVIAKACATPVNQNTSQCKPEKGQGKVGSLSKDVNAIIANGKNSKAQLGETSSHSQSTDCRSPRSGDTKSTGTPTQKRKFSKGSKQ
jgi:hypothetical protein